MTFEFTKAINNRMDCDHPEIRRRRRSDKNGHPSTVWLQCIICGCSEWVSSLQLKKEGVSPKAYTEKFDEVAFVICSTEQERMRNENDNKAWWDHYKEYLDTPKWDAKRNQRLAFDNYKCVKCKREGRESLADDVHHRTYRRLGNELLEDLISVCRKCHEIVHGKKFGPDPKDYPAGWGEFMRG